jgi:hypothetical protein
MFIIFINKPSSIFEEERFFSRRNFFNFKNNLRTGEIISRPEKFFLAGIHVSPGEDK